MEEKYKMVNTTITKEVHVNMDGASFIIIKDDYLNGCEFHDGAQFEPLTQHDELILSNIKESDQTARNNRVRRDLNKASNLVYDLITAEISDSHALEAWAYMDALFDELEKQILNDDTTTQRR
ncbi:MAG: hypothetical protein FWG67_00185 [Defluviitaleaceae bacterium]|nr:hypothetical protein [Defluviitaleaceae bacterium]